MTARIVDIQDGLITLRIKGELGSAELRSVQDAATKLIEDLGTIRVLVLAEEFAGWGKSDDWGDTSFQSRCDAHIEKIAIVGEQKWEDLALLFTARGLRPFPIEYFHPKDIAKARSWLAGTE